MNNWIKAYWAYRLEKGKQENHVYVHFPWLDLLFVVWLALMLLSHYGVIK